MGVIYFIVIVSVVLIVVNYYLGAKLYILPKNAAHFNNVKEININNFKDITPSPKYVITITILSAIVIGAFFAICGAKQINIWMPTIYALVLLFLYIIEISRSISLNENTIILSRLFRKDIIIPITTISGMYIYSYNKKLLKKHAFTTKLVIATGNKTYKYTISSLENKAILNMMKNSFGITEHKMFIAK